MKLHYIVLVIILGDGLTVKHFKFVLRDLAVNLLWVRGLVCNSFLSISIRK